MLIFCVGIAFGAILFSLSAFIFTYLQLSMSNEDFEPSDDDYPFTP
jgi:hypothetical protein